MPITNEERAIRYLYNWYKRQSYITFLFKVKNATEREVKELIKAVQKYKQCHAEIVTSGVTNSDGVGLQSLLAISVLVSTTALPLDFYKDLRRRHLQLFTKFLQSYEVEHDITVLHTLDLELFKQFIAYELPFIFNLPSAPTLKTVGDEYELTFAQFDYRYKSWCLDRVSVLLAGSSEDELHELVKDSPIYEESKCAELTTYSEKVQYFYSCFAEKLAHWCNDEVNAWLKHLTTLE